MVHKGSSRRCQKPLYGKEIHVDRVSSALVGSMFRARGKPCSKQHSNTTRTASNGRSGTCQTGGPGPVNRLSTDLGAGRPGGSAELAERPPVRRIRPTLSIMSNGPLTCTVPGCWPSWPGRLGASADPVGRVPGPLNPEHVLSCPVPARCPVLGGHCLPGRLRLSWWLLAGRNRCPVAGERSQSGQGRSSAHAPPTRRNSPVPERPERPEMMQVRAS